MNLSRQRVHILLQQNRIKPIPKRIGNYWIFTGKEKIIRNEK